MAVGWSCGVVVPSQMEYSMPSKFDRCGYAVGVVIAVCTSAPRAPSPNEKQGDAWARFPLHLICIA